MRISDWRSDVCSSDLHGCRHIAQQYRFYENLHLLVSGATGSGKSVLLRNMAASVLARSHSRQHHLPGQAPMRNDRMIVIDPNGALLSKFWQLGDVILNPSDASSEGWSFFNEVRADYDWKRLAPSLVPITQDKNN